MARAMSDGRRPGKMRSKMVFENEQDTNMESSSLGPGGGGPPKDLRTEKAKDPLCDRPDAGAED
ncbi:hypothetical protein VCV18_007219 [Metarhizium anisopliae]